MALEVDGDYAAAADAYARALGRDRNLPNVHGRLRVAGREAVRRWTAGAGALDPVGAADAYLAADGLVRRAAAVGVDLERPASFETDRDARFDIAVDDLLRQSDGAAFAGDYAGALRRVDRARAFRPSPEHRAELDAAARDAYAGWAEADARLGRYRAAYGRIQSALALTPPDDPATNRLLDVLDRIVVEGTVVAAVFPAGAVGDSVPPRLARDVAEVLADEELAALPPLLALADPADVRRALRRQPTRRGAADRIGSPRRAAELAREVGADLGVTVEVGPFGEERTAGEAREERVRLRRGAREVTVRRRTDRLALTADAAFAVVDARSGRVVCEGEARERASGSYEIGLYDGDWADLDLPRSARDAFRPDAADVAFEDLLAELRDALAASLAERAVRCLEAQVP